MVSGSQQLAGTNQHLSKTRLFGGSVPLAKVGILALCAPLSHNPTEPITPPIYSHPIIILLSVMRLEGYFLAWSHFDLEIAAARWAGRLTTPS